MTKQSLKLGLDYRGVITDSPEFFKELATLAMADGWEVHVISGGPEAKVRYDLSQWKIPYTKVFAILDFYEQKGQVTHLPNDGFKIADNLWNTSKANYCQEHKINLHIDDGMEFTQNFSTPFGLYDPRSKTCCFSTQNIIDFKQAPIEVFKQLKLQINLS